MTDPERMTADELEALAAKARSASSHVDRANAHAMTECPVPMLRAALEAGE